MTFEVRQAILSDCDDVALLIKEYFTTTHQMDDTPNLTGQDLAREAFFSDPPSVHILVAENTKVKKVIGYCLYFYTYSMWKGKAIQLESLHVQQSILNNDSVADAMLTHLARIAEKENLPKITFEWKPTNPEVDLNKQRWIMKYGAEDVTLSENWHIYHFVEKVVQNLAQK